MVSSTETIPRGLSKVAFALRRVPPFQGVQTSLNILRTSSRMIEMDAPVSTSALNLTFLMKTSNKLNVGGVGGGCRGKTEAAGPPFAASTSFPHRRTTWGRSGQCVEESGVGIREKGFGLEHCDWRVIPIVVGTCVGGRRRIRCKRAVGSCHRKWTGGNQESFLKYPICVGDRNGQYGQLSRNKSRSVDG